MNGGSIRRFSAGFTIIETLIVLAITMVMFLAATALINGKQRTTAFNQSIHAVQNDIQQEIATVSSGNYVSAGNVKCEKSASGPLLSIGAGDIQGTNQDCLYLGKVLKFDVGPSDPQSYDAYTIVGLRPASSSTTFSLDDSKAKLLKLSGTISTVPLQYGLRAVSMQYVDSSAIKRNIDAVGFGSNLATLGDGDNSQSINLLAVPDTDDLKTAVIAPASVEICFASGGTDQSGLVTLGGANRQSTVNLRIYGNGKCQ